MEQIDYTTATEEIITFTKGILSKGDIKKIAQAEGFCEQTAYNTLSLNWKKKRNMEVLMKCFSKAKEKALILIRAGEDAKLLTEKRQAL